MERRRQRDLEVRPCLHRCSGERMTHLATIVVLRLVVERGDHQPRYKKNVGEREENNGERKSPPDGPWVGGQRDLDGKTRADRPA